MSKYAGSTTKAYYFKGRNTAVMATSAKQAREKKKRGGDEIVTVRKLKPGEAKGGKWSRLRRDGKPPEKSAYGKGRGYGPPR
jgi:hypothetical protein